jgi:hypothetical protein
MFQTAFSVHTVSRLPITSGGLAKAGGSLPLLRATHLQVCTALSAGLHPRLRQTACCALVLVVSQNILSILSPQTLTLSFLKYLLSKIPLKLAHQRPAAWRRRGAHCPLLRATNVHFRTTLSAGLHPRLRQTAR